MIKYTKTDYPDIEKYEQRINANGFIYFDKGMASRILKYDEVVRATRRKQAEKIIRINSSNRMNTLDEGNILTYLEDVEGCPTHRFNSKKTVKGYTLDMTKVLRPLLADGYATEFLEKYTEFKSLKSKCSRIKSLTESMLEPVAKNMYGDDLYKIYFNAMAQTNLRFNYNSYDIITIPKEYNQSISVPEDCYMVWGDFAQSDLRIAYNVLLRDETNAEVMDETEDKYEGMAKILANKADEEFNLEEFKSRRNTFKVNVLAPIYGQKRGATEESADFISKMISFLEVCPRYQEFKKRLRDRIELGLPLQVTSYFGHDEIIQLNLDNIDESINFALNSPIQTGTSEIIILTVNRILDMFYERGYTEEDISVYYVRHDEPIFIMKKHVMKDAWIFKECSEILVDNWTPLKLDFFYGFRYKEYAEQLQQRAENIYKLNSDKITILEQSNDTQFDYLPTSKTLCLHVGCMKLGDKQTIIAIYNEDKNAVKYYSVESTEDNVIMGATVNSISKNAEEMVKAGYSGILVYNSLLEFGEYKDFIFIKGKYKMSNGVSKANLLAKLYASALYSTLETNEDLTVAFKNNKHWIETIKDVKYAGMNIDNSGVVKTDVADLKGIGSEEIEVDLDILNDEIDIDTI